MKHRSLQDNFRHFVSVIAWTFKTTWELQPALFGGLILANLLVSVIPAGLAWVWRNLINASVRVLETGSLEQPFLTWILVAGLLAVLQEVMNNVIEYVKRRQNDSVLRDLTVRVLAHSAQLEYAYFEDPEMQNTIERAQSSTVRHFTNLLDKVLSLIRLIVEIITLVAVLIVLSPLTAIVVLGIALPFGLYQITYARRSYKTEYNRTSKRRWARYHVSLLTNYKTLAEIKLNGLAATLIRKFKSLQDDFIAEDRALYTGYYRIAILFGAVFSVVYYLLFLNLAVNGFVTGLTIGDLTLFTGVTLKLRANLDRIAIVAQGLTEEVLYIGDLKHFLTLEPKQRTNAQALPDLSLGEIIFDSVSFSYPGTDKWALRDINLHIAPGETVAIIGKNGSGKSTLVNLIAQLYEPTEGKIVVDKIDITKIDIEHLHKHLAFVRQDFNRYEATALDNILFGDPTVMKDWKDIEDVVKQTGLESIIRDMPQQQNTMLGRRFGLYDLSGGMWQKFALARTLIRTNASILILDEPTSALDVHAEWALFQQFQKLADGRTTIIISHRFTTVSMADRIILMDDGQIVEKGTHDELLLLNGDYAKMYTIYNQQMSL